jgi:L-fuculose-phosphate aldolase
MRAQREALLRCALASSACGLNRGTSGNASVRVDGGFLITPTGMSNEVATPDDMVLMSMDGTSADTRKPSSEWRFHRDIYAAKPEADAVLHAHAPFATSLACMRMDIPPFHYMVARFGGATLRCADYATFGTQALSDNLLRALEGRSACLMANHGMTVLAKDIDTALAHAVELEALCEQYWRVLQLGKPHLLDEAEMRTIIRLFDGYGQQ